MTNDKLPVFCTLDIQVCSILNGEKLLAPPSSLWITKDSLGRPNGHQYLATASQVDDLLDHVRSYESPYMDLRPQVRRIEEKLLGEYAGLLIGNQCLDFGKQDGVTEMEEVSSLIQSCRETLPSIPFARISSSFSPPFSSILSSARASWPTA